jgi:hypothetical protein
MALNSKKLAYVSYLTTASDAYQVYSIFITFTEPESRSLEFKNLLF